MAYDATGMERVPFDGRVPAPWPSRRHRYAHAGHGPRCSSNPEIGCLCGEDERASLRAEAIEARQYPNAAAEGVVATPAQRAAQAHAAAIEAHPTCKECATGKGYVVPGPPHCRTHDRHCSAEVCW